MVDAGCYYHSISVYVHIPTFHYKAMCESVLLRVYKLPLPFGGGGGLFFQVTIENAVLLYKYTTKLYKKSN